MPSTTNTYCINLLNKRMVTTFSNYQFNEFVNLGEMWYGGNRNGLFLLSGSSDNGTAITSTITFPSSKFNSLNSKQLRMIKIFGEFDYPGFMVATISADKSNQYAANISTVSKGLIKSYIPFKVAGKYVDVTLNNNNGNFFLLDLIEVVFIKLGRM